jgi:hypothetical protein
MKYLMKTESSKHLQLARTNCQALLLAGTFAVAAIASASAQISVVGPFTGTLSEAFETDTSGFVTSPYFICGGEATLEAKNIVVFQPSVFSFLIGDSSMSTPEHCVVPSDGVKGAGFEAIVVSVTNTFNSTVLFYGGYWGATSFDNPAMVTLSFFDANNQLIGSPQSFSYYRANGDGILEWHGWNSSTPIKRVIITTSGPTLVMDGLQAGTPTSMPPFITAIDPLGNGQMQIAGMGLARAQYSVQANVNLATTNWITLGTVVAGTNGAINFTDSNAASFPMRFYRLKVN